MGYIRYLFQWITSVENNGLVISCLVVLLPSNTNTNTETGTDTHTHVRAFSLTLASYWSNLQV